MLHRICKARSSSSALTPFGHLNQRGSFLLLLLMCCTLLTTACEENNDVTTPQGGYNVFKNALEHGNGEMVWSRMDQYSKEFFDKKFQTLVQMDETIIKYLPPTDHAIAKRQAGTVMLDKASNGKELFLALFDASALKSREDTQDWATILGEKGRATFAQIPGIELPKIVLSQNAQSAVVDAPGMQVAMVKEAGDSKTPEWKVDLVRSGSVVKQNLSWIDSNHEALTKTVDELITEQQKQREELIASLMGYKKS